MPPPSIGPSATERLADEHAVVELETEQLVAGGDALARPPDEPVVFVRGALPGERVRARIVERHGGWNRADLVEVVVASPDRVEPPCVAVDLGCGGCDLQHAAPGAQPGLKAATVLDALRRLGGIDDPPLTIGPALSPTGFRTTVRAAVVDGRAGFRRHRSHDVVVPPGCLVAHPLVDEVLVEGRFGPATEVTIRVGAATGERLVVVTPSADEVEVPADVSVVGVDELRAGRRAWIHDVVAERRWRISAHSFFQTRADGAEALVDAVRRATGGHLAGARVVDAYSGVGLLAGSLLDGGSVDTEDGRGGASGAPRSLLAVERSASSVADARVNLAGAGARIVRSDVERWHPSAADLVVADPARAGLGRRAVRSLVATGASTLVLVSCDAASLGRDARLLRGSGFRLEHAELVDLFPHSHHVEVVSRFVR